MGHGGRLSFLGLAPGLAGPRPHGRAVGHAVQPAGDGLGAADGAGLAGQHQEGGLEGVLAILIVAQLLAANVPDQRPVAGDQGGEGVRVAVGREALQELGVGQARGRAGAGQPAEVADDRVQLGLGHGTVSPKVALPLLY